MDLGHLRDLETLTTVLGLELKKMASFISPVRPIETGPPWNWNPAETFQSAFISAQENRRAQEKAAIEMELAQILLPVKQKTAALALDKMQFEVERQSLLLDKERTATKQAARDLNGELRDGNNSNPGGGRYGSGVAEMIKSYQSGAAMPPSGGGGGGKILGTGLNP